MRSSSPVGDEIVTCDWIVSQARSDEILKTESADIVAG
jgi:hypothetical protein